MASLRFIIKRSGRGRRKEGGRVQGLGSKKSVGEGEEIGVLFLLYEVPPSEIGIELLSQLSECLCWFRDGL